MTIGHSPARERHLRELADLSTQMHKHMVSLEETIRARHEERRHAEDNVRQLEKEAEFLERELRFAGASSRQSLRERLAKAVKARDAEGARDGQLVADIEQLQRQESAVREAQQRCGSLVEAVLKSFGTARQDVDRRMRGKA